MDDDACVTGREQSDRMATVNIGCPANGSIPKKYFMVLPNIAKTSNNRKVWGEHFSIAYSMYFLESYNLKSFVESSIFLFLALLHFYFYGIQLQVTKN